MTCVLITITGFVQGVGFRQFVKKQAQKLDLTGWVQNMPDGSVEAKVFGQKEKIDRLIEICRKGVFLSDVKDVKVEWMEEENSPTDFSILHS